MIPPILSPEQEEKRQELIKAHGGKTVFDAPRPLRYPDNAERQYLRFADAFASLSIKVWKLHEAEIAAILPERMDTAGDSGERRLELIFRRMNQELQALVKDIGLEEALFSIAQRIDVSSQRDWESLMDSLNIDVRRDYYSGPMFQQAIPEWVDENVDLIQTIPQNTLGEMRGICLEGYTKGQSISTIMKAIMRRYDVSQSHAELIARDQTGKLAAGVNEARARSLGITDYTWCTCHDERVRDSHRALDGKVFSFDDPPEMYYTRKHGLEKVYTGRRCNPGEDFQCRCRAKIKIDVDKLNWNALDLSGSTTRRGSFKTGGIS